ncbi:FkbM family methyltransferase [Rhizobium sp. S152]|uniref:FkbM family methyltransferase n=1 Tax=Rhizobium sp. S152 TaxID=3055038 RepID=UPI0025A9AE59|nr:FkbM family methyltransferase [Rhizobium sp. S152]MDM9628783.1 FkbM family methyltransferase [Rhizobium sp. S152]
MKTEIVPPALYCFFINIRNKLRGKKHQISPVPEARIYKVSDDNQSLYICRRSRHNRSKKGVAAGVDALANQYNLGEIPTNPGDLLIDCGANIGELGLWAKKRQMQYIAFEPEPLEARCADLNAFDGASRTHRLALWSENTVLRFFSKAGTADSSAIEMNDFDSVHEIEARRLDTVVDDIPPGAKIILKLEAEGAEPEVLAGAANLLPKIDYVAVDCGFERGKEQTHTFVETNTVLVDYGFRVKKANFSRMTMLYERTPAAQ